jgi:hypothetical protein
VLEVGLLVGDNVAPVSVGAIEGAYVGIVGDLVGVLVGAVEGESVGDLEDLVGAVEGFCVFPT